MRAKRFAICLLWTVSSVASALAQSAVQWQPNLESAKQIAAQSNRLVLIHFWTEACPPCMRMEREVFSRPDVAAAIHANYVPVRINVQKLPNVAREFGVSAWPTDIILSPTGGIVERKTGAADPFQYMATLNQIAARARGPAPQQPLAQTQPPPGYGSSNGLVGGDSGSLPPNEVHPQNAMGPPSSPAPTSVVGTPSGGNQQYRGGNYPAAMGNPAQVAAQPWQPEIGQWNGGAGPSAMAGANKGQAAMPQAQSGPTSGPQYAQRPAGNPSPPFTGTIQSLPPGTGVPELTQRTAPSVQQSTPPLCLDGYCPVTLLEQERWVRGDPRHGVIHRGRTYLFAGPDEAKRFFADPDRYAPVLSGIDVVVAVEENRQVPGKREHGAWYEGRMYLFSSEETLRKFDRDPSRYAAAASQVAQANPRRQPSRSDAASDRDRIP